MNLSSFNTNNVTNMNSMFDGCNKMYKVIINKLNIKLYKKEINISNIKIK